MDEMSTDGDDNVQIKAGGNVVSDVGDNAIVAGRDVNINHGVPFEKYESLMEKYATEKLDSAAKDEKNRELIQRIQELELQIKQKERLEIENVTGVLNDVKESQNNGYSIDPTQEIILGAAAWLVGNYHEAETYFKRARIEFENRNKRYMVGYTMNYLARIFQSRGEFNQAIVWFKETLEIAREFNIVESEINSMLNICICYQMMEKESKYERLLKKTLAHVDKLDKEKYPLQIASVYIEMANYYHIRKNKSKLRLFTRKALQILDEDNNEHKEQLNLARSFKIFEYMDKKNLLEVQRLSQMSMDYALSVGDFRTLSTDYSNLSRFTLEISDDYASALLLAERGLEYAEMVDEFDRTISCKMTVFTALLAGSNIPKARDMFREINLELTNHDIHPRQKWENQGYNFEQLQVMCG